MLDIKFVRENPDVVKENIRKKFQDQKIPMVDEVIALDQENRNIKQEVESLRANKNKISKQIGALMAQGKKEEAEEVKKEVAASGARIDELSAREKEVEEKCTKIDVLSDEIESNLKQCLELKDKRQCPSCFAEIEKDVKFCPHCGAKQEEIAVEAEVLEAEENSNSDDDDNVFGAEQEPENTDNSEEVKEQPENNEKNDQIDNEENSEEKEKTNLEKTVEVESNVETQTDSAEMEEDKKDVKEDGEQ